MPHTTAEPRALSRLHELSTRLLHPHEFGALLEDVLDATIALLRGDFGNVQLYDDTTASLHIVAQRGFGPDLPLGAISAHFRRPPRPTQRELRNADLYAARQRT